MTSTTAVPANTALVLSDEKRKQIVALLREGKTPIEAAAAINALAVPKVDTVKAPVTPPITKDLKGALRKLPQVYGKVIVSEPTLLDDQQLLDLLQERDVIQEIINPLKKRLEDGIKHTASGHFDKKVEEQYGKSASKIKKDQYGHYLVAGEQPVEGSDKKFTRELREVSPSYNSTSWRQAYDKGEITAEMYLAMTDDPSDQRPLNPAKAQAYIVDHPEALLALAKHGTTPGSTSSSIYLRKQ